MTDAEAIASDWRAVGDDIRESLRETATLFDVALDAICIEADNGPLPPPEWLQRFEELSPGAAEEVFYNIQFVRLRRHEREAKEARSFVARVSKMIRRSRSQ